MIERIAQIDHDGCTLRLQRAWPRSENHLLVEYVDDDGRIVPGQWFADKSKLKSIYKQTQASCPDSGCTIVSINDIELLLQPAGADRKLIGLQSLLKKDDTTLISHRPERRAVVKIKSDNQEQFAKVMKPNRTRNAVLDLNYINSISSRSFDVPQVLESSEKDGVIVLSQLSGRSLYDSIQDDEDLQVIRSIGKALRNLHETKPMDNAPIHDNDAEIEVINKWINYAKSFERDIANDISSAAKSVCRVLKLNSSRPSLLHRDFYDKQIYVRKDQKIGFLDFDTLALGEAALDLANVVVHLELRALQGVCSADYSNDAMKALLAGYNPTPAVTNRLSAYKNAARLRLACVYAFRPHATQVSKALVGNCNRY